jgi:folate-dependent phosphoribosylglycinamide formyltransferase PurN
MTGSSPPLNRPIRAVVFGGGPVLERGSQLFSQRLEAHSGIDLVAIVCQSDRQTVRAVVGDLWRRRGILVLPLLLLHFGRKMGRYLTHPRKELQLGRDMRALRERIHYVPDIHADSVLSMVRTTAPDLGLIYGSPILKPGLFSIPVFGTLGIHHGKVPEYRGKKTTFWAMYNGENSAGLTIQKVNEGLDTGEIIQEGSVNIGQKSYGRVWRELEELGLDLYLQAILELKAGTARFRPQTGKKGKLYRDPNPTDLMDFWWRSLRRRLGLASSS